MCGCSSETRDRFEKLCDRRVRFDPNVEERIILDSPGVGNFVNIDYEPRTSTPDEVRRIIPATSTAVDPTWQSRRRRIALDSLGVQTVQLLDSIGALDSVLESIIEKIEASTFLTTTDDDDSNVLGVDTWVDSEIEITLNSGSCEHVMDLGDAPGYGAFLAQSEGSRRKQNFVVGNGHRVPNEGQLLLNLENDNEGIRNLRSTFQVAEVTRPLTSVSRVCDQGMTCTFSSSDAVVLDKTGKTVARFERIGGLYVARMRLKPPEGFVGQVPR